MRNVIISIFLFFSIMVLVCFANNSLLNLCDEIIQRSQDIELTITQGDMEEAYLQSIELMDLIKQDGFATAIYINHQEFDILTTDTVKLSIYLTHKNIGEANSTLHSLKYNAQNIRKLQIPTLENIL